MITLTELGMPDDRFIPFSEQIKEQAIKNGMITLRRDDAMKVLQGTVTIEEAYRVSKEE